MDKFVDTKWIKYLTRSSGNSISSGQVGTLVTKMAALKVNRFCRMERQNSHRFEKRGESKSESCDRCNVHHPSVRPACLPFFPLPVCPSVRPTAPRSRGPTPSITLDPHSDKSNLNVDGARPPARQWGEEVHICTGQEQGGSAGLCGQITTFSANCICTFAVGHVLFFCLPPA